MAEITDADLDAIEAMALGTNSALGLTQAYPYQTVALVSALREARAEVERLQAEVVDLSRRSAPADERFWPLVDQRAPDECWTWRGAVGAKGYGRFWPGSRRGKRKSVGAHRFAYEQLVGSIPDDLTLDHLCRNKLCVNPSHLEAVTNTENVRRAWEFRRSMEAATSVNPDNPVNAAPAEETDQ